MSYQKWTGYPDTNTYTTEDYPYQVIIDISGILYLMVSTTKLYYTTALHGPYRYLKLISNNWVNQGGPVDGDIGTIIQANNPIYTDTSYTTVYFAKTTPTQKPIASIALNPLNNKQYIITLVGPAGEYQKWSGGLPDSPVKTADYPYQIIMGANNEVIVSTSKIYRYPDNPAYLMSDTGLKRHDLSNGVWGASSDVTYYPIDDGYGTTPRQSNYDIYQNASKTTVYFAKTTVEGTPIAPGETPKLSYTKGDILATDGGILQNILDYLITNNAVNVIPHLVSATTNTAGTQVILTFDTDMADPSAKVAEFGLANVTAVDNTYQKWSGYPNSKVLTVDYPYQFIFYDGTDIQLACSKYPLYYFENSFKGINTTNTSIACKMYRFAGGMWNSEMDQYTPAYASTLNLYQSNCPIYTDSTLTTVYFAKTTSDTITTTLPISSSELDTDLKKVILSLNIAGEYQKWSGYPDSPVKTSDYPYQMVCYDYFDSINGPILLVSKNKFYHQLLSGQNHMIGYNTAFDQTRRYKLVDGVWTSTFLNTNAKYATNTDPNWTEGIYEANNNISTDTSHTATYFAKNSPATSPAITNSQTIKTSYTKGTVQSALGGALESYADQAVTNAVIDIVQSNLIAFFKGTDFKNSPQSTTWTDRSGNNNNAEPLNFSYDTGSGSNGAGGIKFAGDNDNFVVPISCQTWTELTMQMTLSVENLTSRQAGIGFMSGNDANSLQLRASEYDSGHFQISDGLNSVYSNSRFTFNQKYVVAIRYKADHTIEMFIDGVKQTATMTGINLSSVNDLTYKFRIGCNAIINQFLSGTMYNVAVYNRALTDTEMLANYNYCK